MAIQHIQGGGPVQAPRLQGGAPAAAPQGGPQNPQQLNALLTSNQIHNGLAGVAGAPTAAQNNSGIGSNRLLSELKPEELQSLGGGSALESLAHSQPSLTVGEAMPLLRRPEALDSISKLLESRTDLKVSDFVSRTRDGKVSIDPSAFDPRSQELLTNRTDLQPSELSAMRSNFTKMLRNPGLAKQATDTAMDLLTERRDIRPADAVDLMNKMTNAVGGTKGQGGEQAGPAAVDMFKNGAELLKKRHDIRPDEVGKLAESVGKLGGEKDPGRAGQVATGFAEATKVLSGRPDMKVGEMSQLAETIKTRFPGDDAASSADRMAAFTKGANMMGSNPKLDAKGMDAMLQKAAEGPPPLKGGKLLNALNTMESGLNSGRATVEGLTDLRPRDPNAPPRPGDMRLNKQGGLDVSPEATRIEQKGRQPGPVKPEGGQEGPRTEPGREQRERPGQTRPVIDQGPAAPGPTPPRA